MHRKSPSSSLYPINSASVGWVERSVTHRVSSSKAPVSFPKTFDTTHGRQGVYAPHREFRRVFGCSGNRSCLPVPFIAMGCASLHPSYSCLHITSRLTLLGWSTSVEPVPAPTFSTSPCCFVQPLRRVSAAGTLLRCRARARRRSSAANVPTARPAASVVRPAANYSASCLILCLPQPRST